MDRLVAALLRLLWAPALGRALGDTLDPGARRDLRRATWRHYTALAGELPREPTSGARAMVRLAAVTVATWRALRDRGLDDAAARTATAKVNWEVYRKLAAPAWGATRLVARDRLRRMKGAMDLLMRFPYAAPGYQMAYVDAGAGVVAFDVRRCPAAEYFAAHELPLLCQEAFCDLDDPLADRWGVTLTRPRTLARGDDRCEFRYQR